MSGPPRPLQRPPLGTARPALRRWLWTGSLSLLFLLTGTMFAAGLDAELGAATALVGLAAAVLPLFIVLPAVLWLDRFESEPTSYLVSIFLWGACVATAGALLLNTSTMFLIAQVAGGDAAREVTAVVVAPVVEELLKGLGVLLVLLLRRREFDGVVDGIVYAATCAAGFAFAENVLYLGRGYTEYGATGLAVVLVTRGVFAPFAHPMFTACFGVGLGIAATRSRGAVRFIAPVVGLLLAMFLHGLWNATALVGADGAVTLYLLLQVPMFVVAGIFAAWARRREGRIIAQELTEYAARGWFAPPEVTMIGSIALRRQARRWAAQTGGPGNGRTMRAFQDEATELAFLRQRLRRGTAPPDAQATELALLHDIAALRARIYAPATGALAPRR
ncbi:MAG: PrsW family intramembrane metalloprotease [Actinobacteria bacterium]|nr:PrsW family intramembrane metalloprotease [Actinomycetota bacterium]